MKLAAVTINNEGFELAASLKALLPEQYSLDIKANPRKGGLDELCRELFPCYEGLLFFCATGIAVRHIAPLAKSKYSDPAVIVVDNGCRYAISLLSGHEGGANRLAVLVSRLLGCEAVITTATEARKDLVLGIGARRGLESSVIAGEIEAFLQEMKIDPERVRTAASIALKCAEPGFVGAMESLGLPLRLISNDEIRKFSGAFIESAASRHLDIPAVALPCALLTAREGQLIGEKRGNGVSLALVRERVGAIHTAGAGKKEPEGKKGEEQ
jgi:cobalamin biosynthesis protein CbiG